MSSLQIGLCFDVKTITKPNYAASLQAVDVLIFPELIDGGYAALYQGAAPHHLDDMFIDAFRRCSKRFSLYCIAGTSYLLNSSSRKTNTSLVFHRGRLLYRYDKIHLFKPANDHKYFSRGDLIGTFPIVAGGRKTRAGIAVCYDLRFPELMRAMAKRGMKLLIVPARWPAAREEAWVALLKARAIENQVFVVGCNARGGEGGNSYAFNPLGKMIFSSKGKNRLHLYTFGINLRTLLDAKQFHHNLKDAVLLANDFSAAFSS
jgi:predicted amidohydrolase